jgi:hypothetical protein
MWLSMLSGLAHTTKLACKLPMEQLADTQPLSTELIGGAQAQQ